MNENQSLTVTEQDISIPTDVSIGALEAAIGMGDFSKLAPVDRLKYLGAVCESVGLNPLTKPLDIIPIQGKLTLYANKGCAEQLRSLRGVNLTIAERRHEHGCYIVVAKAAMPNGRTDESTGVVPFDDRMAPGDKANAIMKAETKAKRRVTLSICGLGMLDVSEVEEMKHAQVSSVISTAETSTDRAQLLNSIEPIISSAGNSGEKSEPTTNVVELTKAEIASAVISTPAVEQPTERKIENTPIVSGNTPPVPSSPAGTLATETVRSLEVVLSENNVQQAMGFLVARGYLVKGADLLTMKPELATKILGNPKSFHRSVETWVKSQSKE
jgi:hypothetical protein